jgi:hypothetical protein
LNVDTGEVVLEEDKIQRNNTNKCGGNGEKKRGNQERGENLGEKSLFAAVAKSSHEESIDKSQICQGKNELSTSCPRETIQMIFLSSVENWVTTGSYSTAASSGLNGFLRDAVQQRLQ